MNKLLIMIIIIIIIIAREMQLEDGRFLMAAERYDALLKVCESY